VSPRSAAPNGVAILGRIALRKVAVPVEHPRVFQVFEELRDRASQGAPLRAVADRPRASAQ
jgi:hypothetical protein